MATMNAIRTKQQILLALYVCGHLSKSLCKLRPYCLLNGNSGARWPNAGVKLAFEPNAQILEMYVGKLAFARSWYWRDGAMAAPATHHTHICYLGQLQLLLSTCYCRCLRFRVFHKKPTPLRTYSTRTRTRMHLKETRKFSISASASVGHWKAGAHRPDQRLYLSVRMCVGRTLWKHICSYYAFYCHWINIYVSQRA